MDIEEWRKLTVRQTAICSEHRETSSLLNNSTKRLQIQNDLIKVNKELEKKRKEVEERREALTLKWHMLKKKQEQFQDKLKTFSGVIEESKIMRYKTLQRLAGEEEIYRQKEGDAKELTHVLEELQRRSKEKAVEIQQHQSVVAYLKAVFETAPNGYFDSNMTPAGAVVRRYKSQVSNKNYLHSLLSTRTDELLKCQKESKKEDKNHEKELTMLYTRIAELRKKYEELKDQNITMDEKVHKVIVKYNEKSDKLFMTVRCIENLSMVCQSHMPKLRKRSTSIRNNPIMHNLQQIEEFLMHKSAVVEHAKMLMKNEMEHRLSLEWRVGLTPASSAYGPSLKAIK